MSTELWETYGTPLCAMRCMHEAELLLDGEPLCIDCADETIWNEGPPLRLAHRAEENAMRPLPPPLYVPRPGDEAQLLELREAWKASPWYREPAA